ncbi:clathrin light chain [Epithele typhae]|uniref:clathrin light chain n=1 Tax=Epithele typhae TaxID=378194 RepID=UPI0020085907|nr:clathrin light chain [Epithele typhae]KAH9942133.1 clathrin light chain [Epithele typhae]
MSDFLRREKDSLDEEFGTPTGGAFGSSGADIDFDAAASAFPEISLDGIGDLPAAAPAAPPMSTSNSFSFDDFSTPKTHATEVTVTGDDEIEKFESAFPDIEIPLQPAVPAMSMQAPAFAQTPTYAPQPAYSSTPILSQSLEEDEPQVIKDHRKAERAIDQFYEEYAAKKERNIKENKEHEEQFLSELSDSLSHGTTWQRICDILELQNSQSKTIARSGPTTSDLTRFKEVLLRLKREGEAAPGAAGY